MVGIGGIGMSALAQYLHHTKHAISGSDREESPVVTMLVQKGIQVTVGHDQCLIPADTQLLVYSDAVPESNVERLRAREMGIPEMSYFEALGEVTRTARTIAVAGTHGKTTTTGMLAKILQYAEKEPTVIVGSIVRDFGSNFLPGKEDLFVIEACEYRDHILKLSPEILVITNIELDHTDYFPNLEALQETFRKAAARVPAHGIIITNPYDPTIAAVLSDAVAPILDYTTQTVPALEQIGEFNRMNARAPRRRRGRFFRICRRNTPTAHSSISKVRGGALSTKERHRAVLWYMTTTRIIPLLSERLSLPRENNFPARK